jgi:hypothetical protein
LLVTPLAARVDEVVGDNIVVDEVAGDDGELTAGCARAGDVVDGDAFWGCSGTRREHAVFSRVGCCGRLATRCEGASSFGGAVEEETCDAGREGAMSRKGKTFSSKMTCRDVMTRPVLML